MGESIEMGLLTRGFTGSYRSIERESASSGGPSHGSCGGSTSGSAGGSARIEESEESLKLLRSLAFLHITQKFLTYHSTLYML